MKRQLRDHSTQLTVIGSGLAGFAASIFALDRGLATAQIGNTGAVAYTSGYLDLLGCEAGSILDDPWQGLAALRRNEPNHPLSRIGDETIREAYSLFIKTLSDMGLDYSQPGDTNVKALLPGGVVKPTFSIPKTMLAGVEAAQNKTPTLIVDFTGLQGFSAKEMVANLSPSWPDIRAETLTFPDMESGAPIYAEVMARALEVAANRKLLAERLKAVLGNAKAVGLPAILGIHASSAVHAHMEELIDVTLFEIPTMPPAVPGIRLRELFEGILPTKGLMLVPQHKTNRIDLDEDGVVVYLEDSFGEIVIRSQAAILATGRFLSGGLSADRNCVREPLVGIPVTQPECRNAWHSPDYFDPNGHPINRSGIEVDDHYRPLKAEGRPVSERLFAAGVVLAHQDWVRQRCGASVAITSAYKAVEAVTNILNRKP
ncbi:MAG: glycerol-3-phosphate dehydrogenase subunit GlpB [Rhodospirillaceae bacterium]|jgi:glycerol-3-phosphate dehydrogenase subunit B|nr:glycerol-3-phosphate dehydrogenase subunit GlpB [Rhodospirillaceae bacterium]MBT6242913.1 glycerol-3-phosphate dehydrogenase subunit GlpB [Rhodospirillaceae bacterium]